MGMFFCQLGGSAITTTLPKTDRIITRAPSTNAGLVGACLDMQVCLAQSETLCLEMCTRTQSMPLQDSPVICLCACNQIISIVHMQCFVLEVAGVAIDMMLIPSRQQRHRGQSTLLSLLACRQTMGGP